MVRMDAKHVFWQALALTVLFFMLGLVFGIYLEQLRADDINSAFYMSETSLYDSFALGLLAQNSIIQCDKAQTANVEFADRIYEEAQALEQFDESNKLTDSIKSLHRKYDLLRTILWINIISLEEKCGNINTAVYLYEYDSDIIETNSKQVVWSRILQDLKEKEGNDIILIPLAVDQKITSLDYMVKKFGVKEFPAVIINGNVIYEHKTIEELEDYLE